MFRVKNMGCFSFSQNIQEQQTAFYAFCKLETIASKIRKKRDLVNFISNCRQERTLWAWYHRLWPVPCLNYWLPSCSLWSYKTIGCLTFCVKELQVIFIVFIQTHCQAKHNPENSFNFPKGLHVSFLNSLFLAYLTVANIITFDFKNQSEPLSIFIKS